MLTPARKSPERDKSKLFFLPNPAVLHSKLSRLGLMDDWAKPQRSRSATCMQPVEFPGDTGLQTTSHSWNANSCKTVYWGIKHVNETQEAVWEQWAVRGSVPSTPASSFMWRPLAACAKTDPGSVSDDRRPLSQSYFFFPTSGAAVPDTVGRVSTRFLCWRRDLKSSHVTPSVFMGLFLHHSELDT